MKLKLGLFTMPYQFTSLEKAFSDAKEFGYDYIELWGGKPHGYAPDLLIRGVDGIRELVDRYDMPIRVYTPEHNAYPFNYMEGDEEHWEESMKYLENSIKVAHMLSAPYMLISIGHSGGKNPAEAALRLRKSLRRLIFMAETYGVTILLETLTPFESDTCTSLSDYRKLLSRLDSPFLCAMLDMVVPYVQGEDPADYGRYLGKRLKHLHLVDCNGIDETHLIPGDGCMDLRKTMKELSLCGYDGAATIELVTHYIDDPSGSAKLAIERTRNLYD